MNLLTSPANGSGTVGNVGQSVVANVVSSDDANPRNPLGDTILRPIP